MPRRDSSRQKKRQDQGRRPRRGPNADSSESARLRRAYREIVAWTRQRLGRQLGDLSIPSDLRLSVSVDLFPGFRKNGFEHERKFAERVEKEIAHARDELTLEELGYHPGHLRCHWCSSSICEHSLPPNPRAVFVGYDPTGTPRWRDFASWVVELRDSRLDRLYLTNPVPLAIPLDRDQLTEDLLPEFEHSEENHPHYVIVAQVIAGLFRLPRKNGSLDQGLAITAQVIERRGPGGQPLYSLNLLCTTPDPHHLPTVVDERLHPVLSPWLRGLATATRDLERKQRAHRREGRQTSIEKSRQAAKQVITQAEKQLEKYLRQDDRRTLHAADRTRDPQRPTASALSDALKAGDSQLFWDRGQRTIIVRGPRNRVHVFNDDGTLVTSIVHTGRAISERIQQGRWISLEASTAAAFRATLSLCADDAADEAAEH